MTSAQFKRRLEKLGCTFDPAKGGHLKAFFGKKASILPMYGSSKEIGKGLEHRPRQTGAESWSGSVSPATIFCRPVCPEPIRLTCIREERMIE